MFHGGELAMHDRWGTDYSCAEGGTDTLMSEAYAKDRDLGTEALNGKAGDSSFAWSAWPRRDDDFLGSKLCDFVDGDLVIAVDHDLGPKLAEIMKEVVGKRVVIVDQQNHDFLHCSASSTALSIAPALLSVS